MKINQTFEGKAGVYNVAFKCEFCGFTFKGQAKLDEKYKKNIVSSMSCLKCKKATNAPA